MSSLAMQTTPLSIYIPAGKPLNNTVESGKLRDGRTLLQLLTQDPEGVQILTEGDEEVTLLEILASPQDTAHCSDKRALYGESGEGTRDVKSKVNRNTKGKGADFRVIPVLKKEMESSFQDPSKSPRHSFLFCTPTAVFIHTSSTFTIVMQACIRAKEQS
ncbi:uncharacterized protein BDR25DRAFT_351016 [Lindgomyces ingoldianus]|uniref:Uncharacterized protein n=1 Tax=Lindgomyces ingoldianus TaxID=673940 RepID=A0ACB6R5P5_9PLEO|nr:uncharacterized protein BDR25DRAFT_351016 [Lindgomyces ingoldianus]KAF2474496.1 hypothetical protein BDR25DRAFT_351016 [Lindgomyces ingoldianus]